MNNEIKFTIIGCIIVFAIMGILVVNTGASTSTSPTKTMMPEPVDNIPDSPVNDMAKYPQTTMTKIDDTLSLKTTITILSIPENNTFPWGVIKGKVNDPAPGHPVIIQFFKSLDESPVHVAQVELNDDDSFEHKFRILSIDEGKVTHYFEGNYYIKVFKTVNIS